MELKIGSGGHTPVFVLLGVLVLISTEVSLLPLPAVLVNITVLTTAFLMTFLVVGDDMRLRFKGYLAIWVLFAPTLILFAILTTVIVLDVAHVPLTFLENL